MLISLLHTPTCASPTRKVPRYSQVVVFICGGVPFLHAPGAAAVAPVALAGRAADGLDLEDMFGAGRQASGEDLLRIAEQAAVHPRAGRAARAEERVAEAKVLRIRHRPDAQGLTADAGMDDVADDGLVQGRLRAIGAHRLEAAGQQL